MKQIQESSDFLSSDEHNAHENHKPKAPPDGGLQAWIGGAQVALLFFVGIFVGHLTDAGCFRPVFALGVLFQLVGVFMMSLCKTLATYARTSGVYGLRKWVYFLLWFVSYVVLL